MPEQKHQWRSMGSTMSRCDHCNILRKTRHLTDGNIHSPGRAFYVYSSNGGATWNGNVPRCV